MPAKIIFSVTLATREGRGARVRKLRGDNKNSAKTAITRLRSICQYLQAIAGSLGGLLLRLKGLICRSLPCLG